MNHTDRPFVRIDKHADHPLAGMTGSLIGCMASWDGPGLCIVYLTTTGQYVTVPEPLIVYEAARRVTGADMARRKEDAA